MERCPTCGRTYQDGEQKFCVNDGTLLARVSAGQEATVAFNDLPPTMPPAPQFQSMPTIQAKKKNNLLLFGGIAAALLALLTGAGLLIILAVKMSASKTSGTTDSNVSVSDPVGNVNTRRTLAQTPSEKYKPELMMAVKAADDAQSNAYSTYDISQLKSYYTGEALKASLAQVDSLKKSKTFTSNTLENQEFEYFKVNDAETEAEVRVIETWTTMLMRTPGAKCLALYQSQKQPQNIYLKKTDSGWMVNVIVYDAGIKQIVSRCPKINK